MIIDCFSRLLAAAYARVDPGNDHVTLSANGDAIFEYSKSKAKASITCLKRKGHGP